MSLKVIAFDADDTLWDNEPYYQEAEKKFCDLFSGYLPHAVVSKELLQTEIANIDRYGYGIKAFILSMIETAIRISDQKISIPAIDEILSYGRELLNKPVHVLDGVEEVLAALQPKYKLVMASKGDLLDQHRKLSRSGLGHYFHHIEIMSEKREEDYLKLIRRLDIEPAEFLMIGNSMKSDVLPVLNIGGHGMHVPYHTTWAHEKVEDEVEHGQFRQAEKIIAVLTMV